MYKVLERGSANLGLVTVMLLVSGRATRVGAYLGMMLVLLTLDGVLGCLPTVSWHNATPMFSDLLSPHCTLGPAF